MGDHNGAAFTPLARWINSSRAAIGMTERRLAIELGWSVSKLRYYTVPLGGPAKAWDGSGEGLGQAELFALADALNQPHARALQAYRETRGEASSLPLFVTSTEQQIVVDEMADLPASRQRFVADMVIAMSRGLDLMDSGRT